MFVLSLVDVDQFTRTAVGEKVFCVATRVVVDQGIRSVEDRLGRTVVLLEVDDVRVRKVPFEIEDVADVGAAKCVDTLVGIADDAEVARARRPEFAQFILRLVRVLVFVDQDMLKPVGVFVAHVFFGTEKPNGLDE